MSTKDGHGGDGQTHAREIRIFDDRRSKQDRRKGNSDDAKHGDTLAEKIAIAIHEFQDRLAFLKGVSPGMTPARNPQRFPSIYVLTVNQNILDIFDTPAKAFTTAETLRTAGGKVWRQTRPGRWYTEDGTMMEIEEWDLK
jgi:hypothetical protein